MISHIQSLFNLICFIYNFFLFTWIYSFFYNSCNLHKKVKIHGKSKIVHQPKIMLAVIYFVLLLLIFRNITFGLLIFMSMSLFLIGLVICDRFIYNIDEKFKYFYKNNIIIFCWKIFHSFFTLIYMCTGGLNNSLNNYFMYKIKYLKRICYTIAKLDSTENCNSYNGISNKKIKSNGKTCESTSMSEYIIKSKKSKSKSCLKKKDVDKNSFDNDINDNDINILNKDIQKLIDNIVNDGKEEINASKFENNVNSKSLKEDLKEKINSINNNVFGDFNEELEDITITEISNIN